MDHTNKKLKPHPQLKHQWFTLVELIIVITILAILATIAFVSFQNYSKETRDSNRVTTLKTIENWIALLETKLWHYPTPEESVEILSWSIVYAIQWVVWDNISREIKLNKTSKDPKTKNYYTYSTNVDKTKYQLWTYLEDENYVYDRLINKVYAENEMKSFYTLWSKLWIFSTNTWVIINKTNYSSWQLDLSSNENNTNDFIVYFSNDKETWKYTWSWNALVEKVIETQESDWIKSWEQTTLPITYSWEWDWNNTWFKYKDNWSYFYPKSCNDLLVSSNPNFKVWNTWAYTWTKFVDWVYYIKPDWVVSEFKVYCDMTKQDWWWTLVLKSNIDNADFYYSSSNWTSSNTTLNSNDFNLTTWNAKYNSFNTLKVDKFMIVLNNHTTVHEMQDSFKNDTMFSLVNKTQSNFNGATYTKDNFQTNYNPWWFDRTCTWNSSLCEIYSYKAVWFNQKAWNQPNIYRIWLMTDQNNPIYDPWSIEWFWLKWKSDWNRNIWSWRNPWRENISWNPYFSSWAIYVK